MHWAALTLRAQVISVLLAGFIVLEVVSVAIDVFQIEQVHIAEIRNRGAAFAIDVVPVLAQTPAIEWSETALRMRNSERNLHIGPASAAAGADVDEIYRNSAQWLRGELRSRGLPVADVEVADRHVRIADGHDGIFTDFAALRGLADGVPNVTESPKHPSVGIYSIRLEGESDWINLYLLMAPTDFWRALFPRSIDTLVGLGLMIVLALLIGHVMRPLDALAASAEKLGRGEETGDLEPQGSADIRSTIIAFNRMRNRIVQAFDYNITLLRSLGHDLAGPLSRLNHAAHEVDREGQRARLLKGLSSIEAMVKSVSSLARETRRDGETTRVDLPSLLDALVEEQADAGSDATFSGETAAIVRGRHNALVRTFRNLIENAIKYGGCAHVILKTRDGMAIVCVDDDGTGIPDDRIEAAFEPFQRLDARGRGSGLGLAIVRTIVVDHGGSVTLANRAAGGLRATVRLPLETRDHPG